MEDITLKFSQFIINNNIDAEGFIEDFYQKNKTDENEKEFRKEAIFNKAVINSHKGNYERSNLFYNKLFEQNLVSDELQESMYKLFICQNHIRLGNKKQASEIINNYFKKKNKHYDLDYLVCYAKITEDKIIQEPYLSVSKEVLFNLGYKEGLPKLYKDLIQIDDLYRKESEELGNIITLQENQERTMRIDSFIKNTKFNFLSSKLNK